MTAFLNYPVIYMCDLCPLMMLIHYAGTLHLYIHYLPDYTARYAIYSNLLVAVFIITAVTLYFRVWNCRC